MQASPKVILFLFLCCPFLRALGQSFGQSFGGFSQFEISFEVSFSTLPLPPTALPTEVPTEVPSFAPVESPTTQPTPFAPTISPTESFMSADFSGFIEELSFFEVPSQSSSLQLSSAAPILSMLFSKVLSSEQRYSSSRHGSAIVRSLQSLPMQHSGFSRTERLQSSSAISPAVSGFSSSQELQQPSAVFSSVQSSPFPAHSLLPQQDSGTSDVLRGASTSMVHSSKSGRSLPASPSGFSAANRFQSSGALVSSSQRPQERSSLHSEALSASAGRPTSSTPDELSSLTSLENLKSTSLREDSGLLTACLSMPTVTSLSTTPRDFSGARRLHSSSAENSFSSRLLQSGPRSFSKAFSLAKQPSLQQSTLTSMRHLDSVVSDGLHPRSLSLSQSSKSTVRSHPEPPSRFSDSRGLQSHSAENSSPSRRQSQSDGISIVLSLPKQPSSSPQNQLSSFTLSPQIRPTSVSHSLDADHSAFSETLGVQSVSISPVVSGLFSSPHRSTVEHSTPSLSAVKRHSISDHHSDLRSKAEVSHVLGMSSSQLLHHSVESSQMSTSVTVETMSFSSVLSHQSAFTSGLEANSAFSAISRRLSVHFFTSKAEDLSFLSLKDSGRDSLQKSARGSFMERSLDSQSSFNFGSSTMSISSILPAAAPTLLPTFVPTDSPTFVPVFVATDSPTFVPTFVPTDSPTVVPVFVVTDSPTFVPTFVPTDSPTFVPVFVPTDSPTFVPVFVATDSPTFATTFVATDSPTVVPVFAPTALPTTYAPTKSPTFNPTHFPTLHPTNNPTYLPGVPTPLPTFSPTPKPTQLPTSRPSISPLTIFRNYLYVLERNLTVSSRVSYSDLYFNGVYYAGGKSSWNSYYAGSLVVPSLTKIATELVFAEIPSYGGSVKAVTCWSASAATSVVSLLQSSSTSANSVSCQGSTWVVRQCNGRSGICVNCTDPCLESCVASLVINPSRDATCPTSSFIHHFAVGFVAGVVPNITVVSSSTQTTSLSVTLQLTSAGTVYCGAFASGSVVSSRSSIKSQSRSATFSSSSEVQTIAMTGLQPLKAYDVYCYSIGSTGTMMSLAQAKSEKQTLTTACCKKLNLRLLTSSVQQFGSALNAVQLSVDYVPSSNISVLVSSASGKYLIPIPVVFSSTSQVASPLFMSIPASSTQEAGVVNLTAVIAGPSSAEYFVEFSGGSRAITVRSTSAPLPAPVLRSAQFSNDGSQIVAKFDSATNKGGFPSFFTCSKVFNFTGDNVQCQFTSTTSVTAYLGSSASIVVGEAFSVLSDKVSAACSSSATTCAFAAAASVAVQAPSIPLYPSVSVSLPALTSGCGYLRLDLSNSLGHGGRSWTSYGVVAESSNDVTSLNALLSSSFQLTPPMSINVADYMTTGQYTFSATLCNFLGYCSKSGSSVIVVSSVVPIVAIFGDAYREQTRSKTLQLSSDAYVPSCSSSGAVSRVGLTSVWTVYVDGVKDSSIVSSSASKSNFRLAAFALQTEKLYTFELRVSYSGSIIPPQATSVAVYVPRGSIVAKISGASTKLIRSGGSLSLDASPSYDEDVQLLTGAAAGLSFSWACITVAPDLSDSCGLVVVSQPIYSTLIVNSSDFAVSTNSRLTVTAFDSTRSSSSSLNVIIVGSSAPSLSVSSNSDVKFNPSGKLVLTAGILRSKTGSAEWTVTGISEELSSLALTPTTTSFASSKKASSVPFNLVIGPGLLPQSTTLTFTLSCTLDDEPGVYISIEIVTNGPPQPGSFVVSPGDGTALSSTFTFSASSWQDSDTPLTYQFGFISESGEFRTVKSQSQLSYVDTLLPAGRETQGYELTCMAKVFDVFNANASADFAVTVKRLSLSSSDLKDLLASQLSSGSGNPDVVNQVLSAGSASLNYVNCTLAPNCTTLHRAECSRVANTCGECESSYYGDGPNSNTLCYPVNNEGRRLSVDSFVSTTCSSDSDCPSFESCLSSVCMPTSKSCTDDCSGQGTCTAVDVSTAKELASCDVGDSTCEVYCVCNVGWYGSTCSLSETDFASKQSSRESLITALLNLTAAEDPSSSTISGWVSNLESLVQQYDELTESAYEMALAVALVSIEETVALGSVSYEEISGILNVLSYLGSYESAKLAVSLSSGRRLFSSVTTQSSLLRQYSLIVLSEMIYGQSAVEWTYSKFSVICSVVAPVNGTVSVQASLSALELANGLAPNSGTISVPSSLDSLKVAVGSMKSGVFASHSTEQLSNPMMIVVDSVDNCPGAGCNVTLSLQNNEEQEYDEKTNSTFSPTYTARCYKGFVKRHIFSCPLGVSVSVDCDGDFDGTIDATCPHFYEQPVCGSITDSGGLDSKCTMTSYTSSSTTCECSDISTSINSANLDMDGEASESYSSFVELKVRTPSQSRERSPSANPAKHKLSTEDIILIVVFSTFGFILLIVGAFMYHTKRWPFGAIHSKGNAVCTDNVGDGPEILGFGFSGSSKYSAKQHNEEEDNGLHRDNPLALSPYEDALGYEEPNLPYSDTDVNLMLSISGEEHSSGMLLGSESNESPLSRKIDLRPKTELQEAAVGAGIQFVDEPIEEQDHPLPPPSEECPYRQVDGRDILAVVGGVPGHLLGSDDEAYQI